MTGARLGEQIFTFLAYLLFGGIAGVVATFAHRARIEVFGTTLWLGWVVALLAVGAIALGLRLFLRDRLPGFAFALGLAVMVFLFTTTGAGQSVVIPAAPNGFGVGEIWMYGSALITFLPVIWPRLPEQAAATGRLEAELGGKGDRS